MHTMTECLKYIDDVKAFVCTQPASINVMSMVSMDAMGLAAFHNVLGEEIEKVKGLPLDKMTPHLHAKNVTMPTYTVQNKDDVWTIPEDVQTTFDLNPGEEKKLHWIEDGDTRRFIGYNFFGEHPETMIEFFDKHMG